MDEHEIRRTPIFTAHARASSSRRPSADAATETRFERVRRGIYVAEVDWPTTEREARHFVRMQALAESMRHDPVFSHQSAAVLWGIPVIGQFTSVHVTAAGRVGVRSQRGITWHNDRISDDDVTTVDGYQVTSYARTLFDLARASDFAAAVAALDFGLRSVTATPLGTAQRGVTKEELRERAAASAGRRGVRSARSAIDFADARSGSPGESVSRANMYLMRFPAPALQVAFRREDGAHDIVDFDWPAHGAFGEFDGDVKYLRPQYMNERSLERVLLDEKERERRVRRHRPNAIRWGWDVAIRPTRLARRLMHHGLHPLRTFTAEC